MKNNLNAIPVQKYLVNIHYNLKSFCKDMILFANWINKCNNDGIFVDIIILQSNIDENFKNNILNENMTQIISRKSNMSIIKQINNIHTSYDKIIINNQDIYKFIKNKQWRSKTTIFWYNLPICTKLLGVIDGIMEDKIEKTPLADKNYNKSINFIEYPCTVYDYGIRKHKKNKSTENKTHTYVYCGTLCETNSFDLLLKQIEKILSNKNNKLIIITGKKIISDKLTNEFIELIKHKNVVLYTNMPNYKVHEIISTCDTGIYLNKLQMKYKEYQLIGIDSVSYDSENDKEIVEVPAQNIQKLITNDNKNHNVGINKEDKINMFELCTLDNNIIEIINNNINNFSRQIKKYKNILFVCGDYPDYGGAATNTHKIAKYYENIGHTIFEYYYNYSAKDKKYLKTDKMWINNLKNIKKINFIPDLVILKSPIKLNIIKIFNCPIYYLIGGIFTNALNKNYKELDDDDYDKYINTNVLKQINVVDKAFVNSSNTYNILFKQFNIKTNILYSSYIPFMNTKIVCTDIDNNFENRKYNYGLIVSNFDRKIKNVSKSIEFLKDKKNVILIGQNSDQYKKYGFECLDLIDNEKLQDYYKQIKNVIQDSFYESSSNVKVEALYNKCNVISSINLIELELDYKNLNTDFEFKKDVKYIISNSTYFHENINTESLFKLNSLEGYFINQNQTKEIIIFAYFDCDINIKKTNLFAQINLNNKKIGFNECNYTEFELINMYYMFGLNNINIEYLGLSLFYDNYIKKINDNIGGFNKLIFPLIYSYYIGNTKNEYNYDLIKKKIDEVQYYDKDVLLISKLIINFGGVQKTSEQLIEILDKKYNVFILSNYLKGNKYDFYVDQLNDSIPNILIIKINDVKKIEEFINNSNYEFIINNKLDNILNLNINKKINYLCHNSMDHLNTLLLSNSNKIDKLFTINNFNKKLLFLNNFNKPIYKYNICVDDKKTNISNDRSEFRYNIGYIGRFSNEKNIQYLIDSVNDFNKISKTPIKLYLIGSGEIKFINLNNNIIFVGRLTFDEILKYYDTFDYVISASLTEGKPFSILEALKNGIPCIHSNINGLNEIISNNINGFLFDLNEYENIKFDLQFNNIFKLKEDKTNLVNCLFKAYSINIDMWNEMSIYAKKLLLNEVDKDYCFDKNLNLFKINYNNKYHRKKLFINFKPNENIPYGGGNIFISYLINNLYDKYGNFDVTFELENDIEIYLIVDPLKDNKFKKYSLEDVVTHRNNENKNGKIIIRINDCDKTRIVNNVNISREYQIMLFYNDINYFIYNSKFIESYYLGKYNDQLRKKKSAVVINGCDNNIFSATKKEITGKIKIVTHHWSNNMNKGYETYYNLWKYCNNTENLEFIFIGKNVPEMFKEVPINGPFIKKPLAEELNKCQIYITDSRYDSCPNHVLEAISCELPILYSNFDGGTRELCQMAELKIGESFNNFDELIKKIDIIKNNYNFYINNLKKVKEQYSIKKCINKYMNIFLSNLKNNDSVIIKFKCNNVIVKINCPDNNSYVNLNNFTFRLVKGDNVFALNRSIYKEIKVINNVKKIKIIVDKFKKNTHKLDNNKKLNILYCSDSNYYVGLFANLHSLVSISNLQDVNINFMIPIEEKNVFSQMLFDFETKINYIFNKSIIYIDKNIIDNVIYTSKCYNGGGHLLNLGNLSRLLIGEFMNYKKLLYLDSDSIIQNDIVKKLLIFNLEHDLYSACANKENDNNKKRLTIKMDSIINCDYKWEKIIGQKINKDDYVFMGAPFLTNCTKWANVYLEIIKIIKIHNTVNGGVYKLFTMSLQNIIFYKKIGNINSVLNVLQDLGSIRKEWDKTELIDMDILDWSGIYKPWYQNGLYRNLWINHDIMNLSENYSLILANKHVIETFNNNNSILNLNILDKEYLEVSKEIFDEFNKYIKKILNTNKSTIKYNILYVCDAKYLLNKMSRVRFWAIEEMGQREDVQLNLTGPGFINFNSESLLQENILNLNKKFDMVIWYKPLNENYNFNPSIKMPFKTCLRYNEMWDEKWTVKEINDTNTDVIICHHYNDYLKYKNQLYKNDNNKDFYYVPHHSNPKIFKNTNIKKEIDILLSGGAKEKHHPFKFRLFNLILKNKNTKLKQYNIYHHKHPGYNNNTSFTSINQINYNDIINKSKICVTCTSKHNYRLGKYVEIPMSGSLILGDLPYEDEKFKDFIIEVNTNMSDDEIIDKLIYYLTHQDLINEKVKEGLEWSINHTTNVYVNNLLKIIKSDTIFIISDEIKTDHPEFNNQKWICDILKDEFIEKFPYNTTLDAKKANIIWYLAPWNSRHIPRNFTTKEWFEYLKNKKVIFTQHHIDDDKLKLGQLNKQFDFIKTYGNKIHSICNLTKNKMEKYFDNGLISAKKLWVNNKNFYYIKDKLRLREKFNIDKNSYLVGSFQKDTEGNTDLPKLSKGPDIFIEIVKDMKLTHPNIQVLLTGLRRSYIIKELEKANIKYYYFNMCTLKEINELYNCLDLYLVSSRVEGGPRAIFEAGLTKTPIISTRVGIAPELIARSSLYDHENWQTYKKCKSNVNLLYSNVSKLSNDSYMNEFYDYLIN